MTPFPWSDVAIIAVLILLNGVFAMSELAIVSARAPRLQAAEKRGSRGAAVARQLTADPGRFLSTVQVGITLISILAGAYSGASLGGPVGERLQALLGLDDETALTVGFAVVIAVTTYFSLIVGELVPKQFALRAPEPIAIFIALPMLWLSKIGAPLVWLLDRSSALVFRILGLNRESEDRVTAEELHLIVAEASKSGLIEESERAIISGVVRLADRPVREVMTLSLFNVTVQLSTPRWVSGRELALYKTATFGGMIRDVLSGTSPVVLSKEIYVTTAPGRCR